MRVYSHTYTQACTKINTSTIWALKYSHQFGKHSVLVAMLIGQVISLSLQIDPRHLNVTSTQRTYAIVPTGTPLCHAAIVKKKGVRKKCKTNAHTEIYAPHNMHIQTNPSIAHTLSQCRNIRAHAHTQLGSLTPYTLINHNLTLTLCNSYTAACVGSNCYNDTHVVQEGLFALAYVRISQNTNCTIHPLREKLHSGKFEEKKEMRRKKSNAS